MKQSFFSNIRDEIEFCSKNNQRIRIDWIYPYCLGLEHNNMDDYTRSDISPEIRRELFVELLSEISA